MLSPPREQALLLLYLKGYNRKKMCKAVVNIETGLVFESGATAARWCGLKDRGSITRAVKTGKQGGRHPETQQPLHWRYAEEGGEL